MSNTPRPHRTARDREMTALVAALTPVARLCLRSGKGIGEMVVALKLACIEVASKTARMSTGTNHSQVSAMTGLHRKEVAALTDLQTSGVYHGRTRMVAPSIERIVAGWATDPQFLDKRGEPRPLSIHQKDASFDALVLKYGSDVTPMSVLKELRRLGVAANAYNHQVRLTKKQTRGRAVGTQAFTSATLSIARFGTTLVDRIDRAETSGDQLVPKKPPSTPRRQTPSSRSRRRVLRALNA